MTDNNLNSYNEANLPEEIAVTAQAQQLSKVREPGFYYVPSNTVAHERMAHFDGESWRFVGDDGKFNAHLLDFRPVYGPLKFDESLTTIKAEDGCWPEAGDEFLVLVEVRQVGNTLDGFVQNPPVALANMLRLDGDDDFRMAEELFGQDFLPAEAGTYRMKLRMYIEPAYPLDDHEWADEDPGFEVVSVERVTYTPVFIPESA